MSRHTARITWQQDEEDHFLLGRYTRVHEIAFDGGATLMASASPGIVRPPFSNPAGVDPEEMFVASLASCHMLWFLDFARQAKVEVRSYSDDAEGVLERNADGRSAITRVTLRPSVECDAATATLDDIHHKAHDACFIANSVRTEVAVEPRYEFNGTGGPNG
jgi:organic hydroperoxide reductase OsmC/OhrA